MLWALRLPCNKNSCAMPDIPTTMNIYGDVVTDEMSVACAKSQPFSPQRRGNGREDRLSPLFWRKRVRVERTGDGVTRRPPVLKTGTFTGMHALPCIVFNSFDQWLPKTYCILLHILHKRLVFDPSRQGSYVRVAGCW